jgi:hypothetical protein
MASFGGAPWGEPDDSGPDPDPGDTGGPVLAGGPVLFMCCDVCQDHSCGDPDCDHGELDQNEFARAEDALELGHPGCFCFVTPKEEGHG